jgi:hypothetical protein
VSKRNNENFSDLKFFHLPPESTTPVVHLELQISQRIFAEKFETALIIYSGAWRETDPCRKPEVANLVALSCKQFFYLPPHLKGTQGPAEDVS